MASPHHKTQLRQYLNSHKRGTEDVPNRTRQGSPSSKTAAKKLTLSSKDQSPQLAHRGEGSPSTKSTPGRSVLKRAPDIPVRGLKRLNIKGNKKLSIDWLPDELILKIFSYLDAASLLSTATVCRRWSALANENVLWEPVYRRYCQRQQKKATPDNVNWKRECITQCVKIRNKLIFPVTKRKDLNLNTEKTAFKKLGCKFQLTLKTTDKDEHTIRHATSSICHRSVSVTWHGLELPPIGRICRLKVHALAPLFFDQQQNVVKGCPSSWSLLLDIPFEWRKWSSTQPPAGADDRVQVYFLAEGLLVGVWKEDRELAFITLGLPIHRLRERTLYGTGDRCYAPPCHEPVLDDIDSQYGLHDYSCFVSLRNLKKSIWGMQFNKLFCRKEDLADGYASLVLIRPEHSVDHTILTSDQRLELPWKTDLFDGIIQGVCVLDIALEDERGSVMWNASSPVKVTPSGECSNYDYDGDTFCVELREERGKVCIEIVWVPEREKFFIIGLLVHLSTKFINDWFGTSY